LPDRPRPVRRTGPGLAAALALALLLAACGTPPRPVVRDGPPRAVPAGLDQVPDAVPRLEPLRIGGPNKPYEVLGRWYAPASTDIAWRERGLASWYGAKFHGRPTASGEVYDMFAMTAAHKTLPIPSYARVRNPASGREVIVRVNDRGPFVDGRDHRPQLHRGAAPGPAGWRGAGGGGAPHARRDPLRGLGQRPAPAVAPAPTPFAAPAFTA
jgi:rare lipoprotein A